ncbi:ferrochelatase [Arcobacter sp. KX21116]|uniref:ferrochelatase n=1 Tax=Arcobacter iocasae TaxID=2906515 RepID=UPI0035D3DE1F
MNENKKALVLLNMGGPRDKDELEMFLRNMFNDKNIITVKSDILRSFIATMIVLSRKNSAWKNYEAIGGSSPINKLTEDLVAKLNRTFEDFEVFQVMRYTPPFAAKCVQQLKQKGIEEVVLLPLYPQYSTTTTKSSVEDFMDIAKDDFKVRVIEPFYKNEKFNDKVTNDIISSVEDTKLYNLIFSAHGLPQKIVDAGDPYEKQVNEHVKILSEILKNKKVEFESISLAYQSKVGPLKWLTPSLEDRLKELKDKNVLIYPIAFIVDNSETMFELHIEYEEIAKELGINEYKVVSCVNDSDEFINVIEELIR